jgi:hypothetical protein
MKNAAKASNRVAQKNRDDESHHVVAARAPDAHVARRIIFAVGIGVNDARNGIHLQKSAHRPMHTENYYIEVNARLLATDNALRTDSLTEKEAGIGQELRDMAQEIENGTF